MFAMLRKLIFPIIIIVLAFFLAMIVLQWGLDITGRQKGMEQNVAGRINGEDISWQTWQQIYNSLYQNETQSSQGDVSDDRVRELEQQAWQEIVNDRLLMQQAKKYHIGVTDADVFSYLRYNPPPYLRSAQIFQTDGKFDYQKYMGAMADPQYAQLWNNIEPQVRTEITKIKLQQMVMQIAHVSDGEVRQDYIDENDSITIAAVNAPRTRFTAKLGTPSEDEAKSYYAAHQDEFKVGPRVILELVKVDKEPSQFDLEHAQARAQAIYDTVTQPGVDFAEYAKIYSEDPGTAVKGGDLGWFAKNRMVHEFDSTVWAMKEGQISEPVKTQFGWHIIKNNGFRTVDADSTGGGKGKIKEVSAQHILIKAAPSDETLESLWQRIESVRTAAQQGALDSAAENEGLKVFTTQALTKGSVIQYLNGAPEVVDWAFQAKVGALSESMDLGDEFCLAKLKEKLPPGHADFNAVKDQAEQDVVKEKAMQICRDTLQLVETEVKKGSTLKAAASKYGLTYEDLGTIARDSRLGTVASDPVAIGSAFALEKVGDVSEPIAYSSGVVIFQLLARKSADLSHFDDVRDSLYTKLLSTKQRAAFNAWFAELRDTSDIQNNTTFQRRQ